MELRKIIWAVDPYVEDERFHCSAAWVLQDLAKTGIFEIDPVYLFDRRTTGSDSTWPDLAPQQRLDDAIRRIHVDEMRPLKLLNAPYRSLREAADRLVSYARENRAELIVASTHARGGFTKHILGSFCEALIYRSEIPTLVINPKRSKPFDFRRVLFATDFSEQSQEGFKRLLPIASRLRSKVRIFHKLGYFLAPQLDPTFLFPFPQEALETEVSQRMKDAENWKRLAKGEGVEAEFVMDRTLLDTAAVSILREAESERAVIAMAAQSGPIAGALLGSTTLRVVREASVPVWIFHSDEKMALFTVTQEDIEADLFRHGRTA